VEALDPSRLAAARHAYSVLDVRDEEEFRAGHLEGSGHLPAAELSARRSELPPRDAAVLVIAADGARAEAAALQVETLGYARVAWLDGAAAARAGDLRDRAPAARLWRPSPFLEQVLPVIDPRRGQARVLDLAAGAGRESVYLALRGYRVEAWDHDRGALERARAMGERHGVTIETQVRDLETRDPRLPVEAHDVVMVFRFLHRPLFPRIAHAVVPGGCVVYETYLKGQERFGRPKNGRFLLDAGELPTRFPGFGVEHYEEQRPESGPWLARLLARKPAAGPSAVDRAATPSSESASAP